MSFKQLIHTSNICRNIFPSFELLDEWKSKRENLILYLQDIPVLTGEYKNSEKQTYKYNESITIIDSIPTLRLSSACEGASNCLYSMAELAAQFANKVTNGAYPISFNAIRKNIEKGKYTDSELESWISDLEWYKKIREIRTELTHHSSIFIGQKDEEPILLIKCHRRWSEREEFKEKIEVTIPELLSWIDNAMAILENFGSYLLVTYILPKLPLDDEIPRTKKDKNRWPIFTEDKRFIIENVTIREHLLECGIEFKH
ncbi:MAG: hypothetical protein ACJAWW_001319 [Sulfurimonas sp.]|jgi:hypothetical protein